MQSLPDAFRPRARTSRDPRPRVPSKTFPSMENLDPLTGVVPTLLGVVPCDRASEVGAGQRNCVNISSWVAVGADRLSFDLHQSSSAPGRLSTSDGLNRVIVSFTLSLATFALNATRFFAPMSPGSRVASNAVFNDVAIG